MLSQRYLMLLTICNHFAVVTNSWLLIAHNTAQIVSRADVVCRVHLLN
jgi:hypothetical protein